MSVGADLLRFDDEQLYIVPDFETCHLCLLADNYPWQLAWVVGTNKRIIKRYNYFINWGFPLPVSPGAAAATGFRQDVVDELGHDPEMVYDTFDTYAQDPRYILVSHNWFGFDSMIKKFYAEQIGRAHTYDYLDRVIDTNCLAKAIKKQMKSADRANRLEWQYKLVNHIEKGLKTSLGLCLSENDIPVDKTMLHRADYDVERNWDLWRKQMWQIEI